MTLEELDKALEKTGLDLKNPPDLQARNMVLERYGRTVLSAKNSRCGDCWYKDNGRCSSGCTWYSIPDDSIEAAKAALNQENDIHLFPFFCEFVVPVYEELTGEKDVMEKMLQEYREFKKKYDEFMTKRIQQK